LHQGEFFIYTDHKSLSQLNEQRLNTIWQHKVFTKLLDLQYKVIYRKGSENRAVDSLSRINRGTHELGLISSVTPSWCKSSQECYQQDSVAQESVAKL
jgi:hypothetical protein